MKKHILSFLMLTFLAPVCMYAQSYAQSLIDSSWQKTFLFEEFPQSTVLLKTGVKEQARVNYSMENQQIYFIDGSSYMMLTNLRDIDTIYIQDRKFVPAGDIFYEAAPTNGQVALFITYTYKQRPIVATTDYNGTSRKDNNKVSNTVVSSVYVTRPYKGQFVTEILPHYWLKKGNDLYKANSEKQIVKVFPDKEAAIKAYVSENHVDFNTPNTVAGLVAFCNTSKR